MRQFRQLTGIRIGCSAGDGADYTEQLTVRVTQRCGGPGNAPGRLFAARQQKLRLGWFLGTPGDDERQISSANGFSLRVVQGPSVQNGRRQGDALLVEVARGLVEANQAAPLRVEKNVPDP